MCPAKFDNVTSLQQHIEVEHGHERPVIERFFVVPRHFSCICTSFQYRCPVANCASAFARCAYLANHLLTHSSGKRYECLLCGILLAHVSLEVKSNVHTLFFIAGLLVQTWHTDTLQQWTHVYRLSIDRKHSFYQSLQKTACENASVRVPDVLFSLLDRFFPLNKKLFVSCSPLAPQFRRHIDHHLNDGLLTRQLSAAQYVCSVCEETSLDQRSLLYHLTVLHDQNAVEICARCGACFVDESLQGFLCCENLLTTTFSPSACFEFRSKKISVFTKSTRTNAIELRLLNLDHI